MTLEDFIKVFHKTPVSDVSATRISKCLAAAYGMKLLMNIHNGSVDFVIFEFSSRCFQLSTRLYGSGYSRSRSGLVGHLRHLGWSRVGIVQPRALSALRQHDRSHGRRTNFYPLHALDLHRGKPVKVNVRLPEACRIFS